MIEACSLACKLGSLSSGRCLHAMPSRALIRQHSNLEVAALPLSEFDVGAHISFHLGKVCYAPHTGDEMKTRIAMHSELRHCRRHMLVSHIVRPPLPLYRYRTIRIRIKSERGASR